MRDYYISIIIEWLKLERLAMASIGDDVIQLKLIQYTAGGNVKQHNHFGKDYGSCLKS